MRLNGKQFQWCARGCVVCVKLCLEDTADSHTVAQAMSFRSGWTCGLRACQDRKSLRFGQQIENAKTL